MTPPVRSERLTAFFRAFRDQVVAMAREEGEDSAVDRALTAATLLVGAAVLVWPRSWKAPKALATLLGLAQQIWRRREWWVPPVAP